MYRHIIMYIVNIIRSQNIVRMFYLYCNNMYDTDTLSTSESWTGRAKPLSSTNATTRVSTVYNIINNNYITATLHAYRC